MDDNKNKLDYASPANRIPGRSVLDLLTWAAIVCGAVCLGLQWFGDQYDGFAMIGLLLMVGGMVIGVIAFVTRNQPR